MKKRICMILAVILILGAWGSVTAEAQTYGAPSLSISSATCPVTVYQGNAYNLTGIISTNVGTLIAVSGSIRNAYGQVVLQSRTYNPGAASFDLRRTVNLDLPFGKLSTGSYTCVITATAVNGGLSTTVDILCQSFNVISASSGGVGTANVTPAGNAAFNYAACGLYAEDLYAVFHTLCPYETVLDYSWNGNAEGLVSVRTCRNMSPNVICNYIYNLWTRTVSLCA